MNNTIKDIAMDLHRVFGSQGVDHISPTDTKAVIEVRHWGKWVEGDYEDSDNVLSTNSALQLKAIINNNNKIHPEFTFGFEYGEKETFFVSVIKK